MKTILIIGKTELLTLFYSPVAWLLLIIFSAHCGLTTTLMLENILRPGRISDGNNTLLMFNSSGTPNGLFSTVKDNLYLYIPLLTMGLFSREYSSGSIKLLQSSPVRPYQVVLGKYIAVMGYWCIMLIIVWLIIFRCSLNFTGLDWGIVLSGILGIYLLAFAYSAVGVFMSATTSYQAVAALCTLVSLGVLNFIGGLWQDIPVLRDVSWYLNFEQHISPLLNGLVVSSDVLYFVILIVLFIGASIFWLKDTMSSKAMMVRSGKYVILLVVLVLTGYIFSRPSLKLYYDATQTKSNTLTPATQAILKKINGPVTIAAYVNLLDADVGVGMPSTRNYDRDFWAPYLRFLPNLKLKYVNYYDTVANDYIFKNKVYRDMSLKEIAEKVADGRDWDINDHLPPAGIRKLIDLSAEENMMVRQIQYNGKKSFIRRFEDVVHVPKEQEITTAFEKVISGAATIGFVTGHNERDLRKKGDRDYRYFLYGLSNRNSLVNKGFDMISISLAHPIPDRLSALVIAGPMQAYSQNEIEILKNYVSNGGNLLVCGQAGFQHLLNPLTSFMGIEFMEGTLMSDHKNIEQDYVFADFTPAVKRFSGTFDRLLKANGKILMEKVCALNCLRTGDFKVDTLLILNNTDTWNKRGKFKVDTGKIKFTPANGDIRIAAPLAIALTRKKGDKQQRILILGSSDVMSTADINKKISDVVTVNQDFAENIFKWFSYSKYPLQIPVITPVKDSFYMSAKSLNWFKLMFLYGVPSLALIFGAILLFIRKMK